MRIFSGTQNRLILGLIGLLLVAFGVVWAVAALGRIPVVDPATEVNAAQVLAAEAAPVIALVAGVVLILLALWWLVRLFPRRRQAPPLRYFDSGRQGLTQVNVSALNTAIADRVEGLPDIVRASAVLRGSARAPELMVRVAVNEGSDVTRAADTVVTRCTREVEDTLGAPLDYLGVLIDVTQEKHRRHEVVLQQ